MAADSAGDRRVRMHDASITNSSGLADLVNCAGAIEAHDRQIANHLGAESFIESPADGVGAPELPIDRLASQIARAARNLRQKRAPETGPARARRDIEIAQPQSPLAG